MTKTRATAWIWFSIGFLLAMALNIRPAQAEDVVLNWTKPTGTFTMTDAGPYTNGAGTKIYLEVGDIPDHDIETFTLPGMKPGTYKFVAVSYNTEGVTSPLSAEAEKTVTEWTTIDTRVRIMARTEGSFILPIVGTVPLGTPCDLDVSATGPVFDDDGITVITKTFHAIDASAVTFTGVEDVLILAECG